MPYKKYPFYNRILFWVLAPVLIIGIACSTFLAATMSAPLKKMITQQFDADLRLLSGIGLELCEESFSYLLELRLEQNSEMNTVLKNETMEKIKALSGHFPQIHMMVLESGSRIKACSLEGMPEKWENTGIYSGNDIRFFSNLEKEKIHGHLQYFPFWDWSVVSFMYDTDYQRPVRMAYQLTYVASAGAFLAVVVTLLIVFHLMINRPLNRLVSATDGVAEGKLSKIKNMSQNEFGRLMRSFNGMVDSINQEKAEISHLIGKLEDSRSYIGNIIDSMPSMVIGVNRALQITQWNKAAVAATGINGSGALGRNIRDVLPRLKVDVDIIVRSITTREIEQLSKRPRKKGHETFYEDVIVYPLVMENEEGAVIRIDDVTETVRLEEMLVQNEKMLSVGGLAAGMAHEINNPLAGVIQNANVLSGRLSDTSMPANLKAAESIGIPMAGIEQYMTVRGIPRILEAISESGMRMASIVDNMLSFARKGEDTASLHDPVVLMERTLELALTDYDWKEQYDFKSIAVEKQYGDNLPRIPCESSKIQQVLLNLLNNGAYAMLEKQALGKESDYKPEFIIRLSLDTVDQMLKIEIKDNGMGMDEDTCKRVFEPFFTTKPVGVGTGLGLSVSYFIITKNHKGSFDVASQKDRGTNFIIRLPLTH